MKYKKFFPNLFSNHFTQPSLPPIVQLKILHDFFDGSTSPIKNGPITLLCVPHMMTLKFLPTYMLPQVT